jgi:hypothetical protein
VERLSALTNDEMRASIHTLTALESIYEQETAVLSALDVQGYLRLLAQESKAIHAFQTQRAGVYYAGTIFQQVFVARIKAAEKSPGLFLAASMGAIGTSLIALGMSLSMLFLKLYGLHIFTMQEVTFFYETLLVGNVTALLGFVGSQAVIDWSVVEQLHDDARSL